MRLADRLVRSFSGWLASATWLALTACHTAKTPPAETQATAVKGPSLPAIGISTAYVDPKKTADQRWDTLRDPGPDGTELAKGQAGPNSVAVDDRFVYWTNFEDDAIVKTRKDGSGEPTVIHRNDTGSNKFITVDRTAVYWGGTSLYKQVKATGKTERFGSGKSLLVYNVIPAGQHVYWVDGGKEQVQLRSMKANGTDARAIGSAETQDFMLAIDGETAFKGSFRPNADDEGQIDVVSLTGGPSSSFAKTRYLWGIAVDRKFVYWLEGRSMGAVKKKPRTGGGEAVTLSEGLRIFAPQSLASDGNSLYFTALGVGSGQGAIGKVSKAGGDAKWIAEHQVVPQALAVDEESVYWVNFGPTKNGTVRKIKK
jgi:hypothetical protein